MADQEQTTQKRRTFRKFSYRGVDLEQLLDLSSEQFMELVHCRARRRFQRGLKRKPMGLIKKLRAAKKEAAAGEKPNVVKTHLRDMIVVPEMIGSVVAIYNGKVFNQVEIKPEMVGHYLAEFSISYKPVKHGRPGIGATHSSRFVPLKASGEADFVDIISARENYRKIDLACIYNMADDPSLSEGLEDNHSNTFKAVDTTVTEPPQSVIGLWDIAFIHAFVSTFSTLQDPALHSYPTFQPEQLEQDLMSTTRSDLVDQLLCSFTSNALNRKKTYDSSTIRRGLFELMSAKVKASEFLFNFNPMAGNIDFDELEPIIKLEILRSLVEWQLEDCNAIRGLIEKYSKGNRYQEDNPIDILPVGMDSQKRVYWQFGESARLWREKKGAKSPIRAQWEIATNTLDELKEFTQSIADTKSRTEKQLYLQLINQTIPDIEFSIAQREKLDKKQRAVEKLLDIQLTNDPMSLRPRNRKPVQYRFDDIYDYEDEDDEYEAHEEHEETVSVKTGTRSSRRIAQRETSPPHTPQSTRTSSRLRRVYNEFLDDAASQSSPSVMDEADCGNDTNDESTIDPELNKNGYTGDYMYE